MALALPILGAMAGAFGAHLLGYTTLTALMTGASIGWMVGSWAMMSTMTTKNDPIDTGAQEAPRFNTAVRGAQVPIFFGTNRVPAQIVWQANFETIRHESSSGGGGKAGGSGGGKGGSAPPTTSYSYKIDAVYHLGLSPTPMILIGGWLAGQRINDASISGISTGGTAFSSLGTEGTVGISYDEAVFFPADINEDSEWSWLTSQVGSNVVWPGTAWVGFRGLDLGSSNAMLQLNFEVGPDAGDVQVNTNPLAYHPATGAHATDSYAVNSLGIDANLNCYYGGSGNGAIHCYDADGLLLWELTEAEIKALFIAAGADPAMGSPTNTWCCTVRNGTYLLLTMEVAIGGIFYTHFAICEISQRGIVAPPSIINYVKMGQGISIFYPQSAWEFYSLSVDGFIPNGLIVCCYDFSTVDPHFLNVPSIDEIIAGTYKGRHPFCTETLLYDECPSYYWHWTAATGQNATLPDITHAASQDVETMQQAGMGMSMLDGHTLKHRIYFYQNMSWMRENGAFPTGMAQTYGGPTALGAMFYLDMTPWYQPISFCSWTLGVKRTVVSVTDEVVVDTANWVDRDNVAQIPFDDENTRILDNGAPSDGYLTTYSTRMHASVIGPGMHLVLLHKVESDSSYVGTYGKRIKAGAFRVFVWVNDGKWTQLGQIEGPILSQGDLGVTWDTSMRTNNLAEFYLNGAMYIMGQSYTTQGFLALIGDINMSGADVTPPYIIREILVNETFGIQPGGDIIDEATYTIAHQYCIDHDIMVSTQYRRASGALQHIELLLSIYGGWLSVMPATGKIKFGVMDLQNNPVRTIDNSHLIIQNEGELPVKTTKGAIQDTFNIIRVNYIDREHDYQNNQAEARDEVDEDLNGPRIKEFPPDFVMSRSTAEMMADRALWTNLYVRDAHQFKLGWKDSDLEPGDLITLVDSWGALNEVVQIVKWSEIDRGIFDVVATQQVPYVANTLASALSSAALQSFITGGTSNSSVGYLSGSGTVVYSGIVTDPSCRSLIDRSSDIPLPVYFQAYELPTEFSTGQEIYAGYRTNAFAQGAVMYISPDNTTYTAALNVQPHPLAGTLLTQLTGNEQQQYAEGVEFLLHPTTTWSANSPAYTHNTTMNDVTPSGMHAGAGLMYVGSEMLAYTGLTLLAQNHYRARRVYRGWGGTKVGAHGVGDTWWKHGSGIFVKEYTDDQIGTTFWYKIAPYNPAGYEYDVSSITAKSYTIKGQYKRPASPPTINLSGQVRRRAFNVGSDIDMAMVWEDGARQSGFGAGGFGTAPGNFGGFTTDTLSHNWLVTVTGSGNTVVRSTVVSTTNFTYTKAMNVADNGAWRGNVAFKVTAYSPYGPSARDSVASMNLFY